MKRLALGMFVAALASQAGGCIISSDDSSDDTNDNDVVGGDNARIRANFHFESVAGTDTGCPPDVTGVALVTQTVDSGGNLGSPVTDIFDCEAETGITAPLPESTVNVYVQALGAGDAVMYTSLSQTVDLTNTDKTVDFRFISDGGFFVFDWDLRDNANQALTCDQVTGGIDGVELIATVVGGSAATTDKFDCEDGYGATDPLLEGDYTVSIDAFIEEGRIGDPTNIPSQHIDAPSGINDLGTVVVNIDQ